MKKSYVIPRTTSVEVVTENVFAVSNVTGTGTFRDGSKAINIGNGGSNSGGAPAPTAKGAFSFWDL